VRNEWLEALTISEMLVAKPQVNIGFKKWL
jgi:hypothetical protein